MKNQIFTTKSLLFHIGLIAVALLLSYLDSILPHPLQVEGYTVYQSWVGAAISALGGLAGGVLGSLQARRQTKALDEAQQNLEDWRNGIINTNTLDRADSMSMLRTYREALEEQAKKNNTAAIKGGLSDEAVVAQATATNKGLADAISRIAGYGQQQKDRAEQMYQTQLYNYNQQKAAAAGAGAQTVANAISSASGVLGAMTSDIDWGKKKENNQ
ncbi:MAG: hypothetical protein IIW50_04545 [Alistipes sp.]|nr:hypothetical protein [Alistipes sp.]